METLAKALSALVEVGASDPDYRIKMITELVASAVRLGKQSIALEAEHAAESHRADVLYDQGDDKLARMAEDRASRIHRERCFRLSEAASRLRSAMANMLGSLGVDVTTSHTGLNEEERRMVSEVSGRTERW